MKMYRLRNRFDTWLYEIALRRTWGEEPDYDTHGYFCTCKETKCEAYKGLWRWRMLMNGVV
jgi:hypothetical protein